MHRFAGLLAQPIEGIVAHLVEAQPGDHKLAHFVQLEAEAIAVIRSFGNIAIGQQRAQGAMHAALTHPQFARQFRDPEHRLGVAEGLEHTQRLGNGGQLVAHARPTLAA